MDCLYCGVYTDGPGLIVHGPHCPRRAETRTPESDDKESECHRAGISGNCSTDKCKVFKEGECPYIETEEEMSNVTYVYDCRTCGRSVDDPDNSPRFWDCYIEQEDTWICRYEHMECFTERRKKERAHARQVQQVKKAWQLFVSFCSIATFLILLLRAFDII